MKNILKFSVVTLISIVSFFYLIPAYAVSSQYIDDGIVEYYCNNTKTNFYFTSDINSKTPEGFKKEQIKIDSLLLWSKNTDKEGNELRMGSKIAKRQCGKLTIKFSSGYYNVNPSGQLGLIDYPVITLETKGKVIIKNKQLDLCASGGVKIKCPSDSSIQEINVEYKSKSKLMVTLKEVLNNELPVPIITSKKIITSF